MTARGESPSPETPPLRLVAKDVTTLAEVARTVYVL